MSADLFGLAVTGQDVAPTPLGLGTAMAGGKGKLSSAPRAEHDYYPTPPEATRALVEREDWTLIGGGPIWEPCGRGGAIIRVLREAGCTTIGTDIVADPENDVAGRDLFEIDKALSKKVVTNPPFNLSAAMILHLLDRLDVRYCAMLLKSTYWHAENRTALFRRFPPARIYALNWRLDFIGGGAPVMECAWFVWDRRSTGPTTFDVLEKPGQSPAVADLFSPSGGT